MRVSPQRSFCVGGGAPLARQLVHWLASCFHYISLFMFRAWLHQKMGLVGAEAPQLLEGFSRHKCGDLSASRVPQEDLSRGANQAIPWNPQPASGSVFAGTCCGLEPRPPLKCWLLLFHAAPPPLSLAVTMAKQQTSSISPAFCSSTPAEVSVGVARTV